MDIRRTGKNPFFRFFSIFPNECHAGHDFVRPAPDLPDHRFRFFFVRGFPKDLPVHTDDRIRTQDHCVPVYVFRDTLRFPFGQRLHVCVGIGLGNMLIRMTDNDPERNPFPGQKFPSPWGAGGQYDLLHYAFFRKASYAFLAS